MLGPTSDSEKIISTIREKINIDETGKVKIASPSKEACDKAVDIVESIVQEIEVGKIYIGKVKRILDFGAIVEILPRTDGLVHISELAPTRVRTVSDIVKEGDEILVKGISIENDGRIRLSRKEALGENIEDYRKRVT